MIRMVLMTSSARWSWTSFFISSAGSSDDGGGQEAAGIVAEVEHDGLHAVLGELLEHLVEIVRRLLLELSQLDVADAAAQVLGADGVHADLLALDLEVLRLGPALAHHADR